MVIVDGSARSACISALSSPQAAWTNFAYLLSLYETTFELPEAIHRLTHSFVAFAAAQSISPHDQMRTVVQEAMRLKRQHTCAANRHCFHQKWSYGLANLPEGPINRGCVLLVSMQCYGTQHWQRCRTVEECAQMSLEAQSIHRSFPSHRQYIVDEPALRWCAFFTGSCAHSSSSMSSYKPPTQLSVLFRLKGTVMYRWAHMLRYPEETTALDTPRVNSGIQV